MRNSDVKRTKVTEERAVAGICAVLTPQELELRDRVRPGIVAPGTLALFIDPLAGKLKEEMILS